MLDNNTHFLPQPRITNLDVEYKGPRRPRTDADIRTRFINYLKKHKIDGLYVPDGCGAGSYVHEGTIEAEPNFPYIVTSKGEFIPTKFIKTQNSAPNFMKNIMTMGRRREYVPHRCGDNEEMATIRAGIMCGPGIVKNVHVVPTRVGRLRQF